MIATYESTLKIAFICISLPNLQRSNALVSLNKADNAGFKTANYIFQNLSRKNFAR